ncbi:MAG TPA: carboxypeptidase-like regulatory domain-containing protein, partial [Chitinophagaceae bacterium]
MRKVFFLVVALFCGTIAFSQNRAVTGKIQDDKGDPVPFATVTESGTKHSVQADANGFFSITVKEGSSLLVTSTGHKAQTLPATGGVVNFL